MENAAITLDHVSFSYALAEGESHPALRDVSLEIKKGEFTAVIGHNGSGKSTLAKMLNALLVPDEGKVAVLSMDTSDEQQTWNIRQAAGLVFQNPDNQLVTTIVEEDVAFGPENLGVAPTEIRERVDRALKSVGMEAFALSAPHMLSGGQKQRIAIAGILAMEPQILILDESTAMLDPQGRAEVMAAVMKLKKERNMTVVWITHFMDEAAHRRPRRRHGRRQNSNERHAARDLRARRRIGSDPSRRAHERPHRAGNEEKRRRTFPYPRGYGDAGGGSMPIKLTHVSHVYMPGHAV